MLVVDTSALLKRYLAEQHRDEVLEIMDSESVWCASLLAVTEARIALCRIVDEQMLGEALGHLEADAAHLTLVPVDDMCLTRAAEIGCATGVRTLDALHLAAADRLPRPIKFLTLDHNQRSAAEALNFEVVLLS